MAKRKKETGAKTLRTETVGVRLDARLRYLAELAAREQQRTLSNFIEWAIRQALTPAIMDPEPRPGPHYGFTPPPPLWNESLWSPDEAERFINLALFKRELMTLEELADWKTIEVGTMKDGKYDRAQLRKNYLALQRRNDEEKQ